MNSTSGEIDHKPRRHGPYRLRGFSINGWVSGLFRRLAWECQDRRSALGIMSMRAKVPCLLALAIALVVSSGSDALAQQSVVDQAMKCESKVALAAADQILKSNHVGDDPFQLLAAADALFRSGRRDEAAFWSYAGLLRLRDALIHNPVQGGIFTVFQRSTAPISNFAQHSPRRLATTIEAVLDWDRRTPNPFRMGQLSNQQRLEFEKNREGMKSLASALRADPLHFEEVAKRDQQLAQTFVLGCRE